MTFITKEVFETLFAQLPSFVGSLSGRVILPSLILIEISSKPLSSSWTWFELMDSKS